MWWFIILYLMNMILRASHGRVVGATDFLSRYKNILDGNMVVKRWWRDGNEYFLSVRSVCSTSNECVCCMDSTPSGV